MSESVWVAKGTDKNFQHYRTGDDWQDLRKWVDDAYYGKDLKSLLDKNFVDQLQNIESAIIKAGINRSFETGYAAYLVAEKQAEEQVKLGNSVVIDAVNAEDEAKQVWIDCAAHLRIPLVVIECVLKDEKLHRARIEARVRGLHGFDEITWERVNERRKVYTPCKKDILSVEMSNDSAAAIDKAKFL